MHEKYAKEGLVVISVALDDIKEEPEAKERALKFLKDKRANFTNLLLDEPIDFWQKKFEFVGPPTVESALAETRISGYDEHCLIVR